MLLALHTNWWEDWLLYHKVIFDGENKLIIVNDNQSTISVKEDIYSSWKEWIGLRDNAKFLPAVRTTGGDPAGGGLYTGDVYFLINGWRILITNNVNLDGVIYSDDYPSPFVTDPETKFIINKVSNLVQSLGFQGTLNVPTTDIAQTVWDYILADADTPGSIGERVGKLLTVAKYLGLK